MNINIIFKRVFIEPPSVTRKLGFLLLVLSLVNKRELKIDSLRSLKTILREFERKQGPR